MEFGNNTATTWKEYYNSVGGVLYSLWSNITMETSEFDHNTATTLEKYSGGVL